ncbi:hypothetical protein HK098_002436 [Nowakowskiella sp. JEL0407]|nr:hypothetical protein HK098_002436 [Nowakowskiella sp. JEL0407]
MDGDDSLHDEDLLDEDAIFEELERGEDIEYNELREKRIEELQAQMSKLKEMQQNKHGTYTDVQNDKDILEITTTDDLVVVHFYHLEFRRCQIIDKHLNILAPKHFRTRFVKVDVAKVPFLVDRLKVQILPCLICFVKGIAVDRVVGFDELGGTDSFTTATFEKRLAKSSKEDCVIEAVNMIC